MGLWGDFFKSLDKLFNLFLNDIQYLLYQGFEFGLLVLFLNFLTILKHFEAFENNISVNSLVQSSKSFLFGSSFSLVSKLLIRFQFCSLFNKVINASVLDSSHLILGGVGKELSPDVST